MQLHETRYTATDRRGNRYEVVKGEMREAQPEPEYEYGEDAMFMMAQSLIADMPPFPYLPEGAFDEHV